MHGRIYLPSLIFDYNFGVRWLSWRSERVHAHHLTSWRKTNEAGRSFEGPGLSWAMRRFSELLSSLGQLITDADLVTFTVEKLASQANGQITRISTCNTCKTFITF